MFDVLFLAQGQGEAQPLGGVDVVGVEPQSQTVQDSSPAAEGENGTVPGKAQENPWIQYLPLLIMVIIVYFFMLRAPQKKEKARKQMLSEIKKGDRVRTIGGIYGTVAEVREKEVVIKIDESNNTRIRMMREAISEILAE